MAEYGENVFNPNIGSSADKNRNQNSFSNFELSFLNASNTDLKFVKTKLIFLDNLL